MAGHVEPPRLGRRWLLTTLSRAGLGVAVLGAACTSDDGATTGDPTPSSPTPGTDAASPGGASPTDAGPAALRWERADLGFVSAYVLVRGGEAVVVDTGVEGSAGAIEAALAAAGVGWDAVGDVVLTHRHPDHVGSVDAVLEAAAGATVHAGADDVAAVPVDGVQALADGDRVFDLTIVATPGHTPGHVCVHDPATGLLVAGDALNGTDGSDVRGPNPEFSSDMDAALTSVGVLGGLDVSTILFGHGEPYEGDDAADRIAALAAG